MSTNGTLIPVTQPLLLEALGLEDPDMYQADKFELLQRLKAKREEQRSMLRALDDTLVDLGYIKERTSTTEARRERSSKPMTLQQRMQGSGIRIHDKLSCRGEDAAKEFFAFLDDDSDSFMSFKDFRSMQTKITPGYLHPPENMTVEAWRLYMTDVGATIRTEGVDVEGFGKYRKNIEFFQPLSRELIAHDLNLLPLYLNRWKELKQLIKDVKVTKAEQELAEKAAIAAKSGGAGKYGGSKKDDLDIEEIPEFFLTRDDISFILGNLEIPYYKFEYIALREKRVPMEQVCLAILTYYLKTNFATSPGRFGHLIKDGRILKVRAGVGVSDIEATPEQSVAAFVFGDRISSSLRGLTRSVIIWKYKTIRSIRLGYSNLAKLFDVFSHLRTRMVFRDFITIKDLDKVGMLLADPAAAAVAKEAAEIKQRALLKAAQKKGAKSVKPIEVDEEVHLGDGSRGMPADTEKFIYNFSGELGPDAKTNMDSGIGINFKSSLVADWDILSSRMNITREAGTVFNFEFLLKPMPEELTEEEKEEHKEKLERKLDSIRSVIRYHFEVEMKRNSMFFKEFSLQTGVSEADGAHVVRFCIIFRKLTAVDSIFTNLYIPYTIAEIVPDVAFELKTNATMFDIVSATHSSIDHLLSAKFTGKLTYRRNIFMNLLKRTWLAMSSTLPKRFAVELNNPEDDKKKKAVKKKSADTTPTKDGAAASAAGGRGKEGEKEETGGKSAVVGSSVEADDSSDSTASMTPSQVMAKAIAEEARTAEEEMLRRDRERWAGYQQIFPSIVEIFKSIYSTIADVKNFTSDINIKNASDLLDKVSYLSRFFRTLIPAKCAKTPGYVKGAYDRWSRLFYAEMNAIYIRLKAYLEGRLKEEEAKRRKYLMDLQSDFSGSAKSQHNKTSETLQRLKSLGVEATADDLVDEDPNDVNIFREKEQTLDFQNEILAYIAFENFISTVSALHCVELISGINKYTASMQGMDIFDLFPKFPSLIKLKREYEESKQKTFNLKNKKL